MDKKELRRCLRARRTALSAEDVCNFSHAAQEFILADAAWGKARSVGLYLPVRNETESSLLVQAAHRQGKRIYLPCTPESLPGEMFFLPYAPGESLCTGSFGIAQPRWDERRSPALAELPELLIVPAVAYDSRGWRLGSGGGYYDRFFARHRAEMPCSIGLVYSFQCLKTLQPEAWDIPVEAVATEKGLTWF